MKHKRFEENILVDEAYTNYSRADKNEDKKKSDGIAKHFAQTLEYDEKKKWYHQLPQEPSSISQTVSDAQIEELRKEASSALHGDTMAYETKTNRSGSSDHQWAKTLLNKGAIGDRVAAATILIQDNPVYNLTALRNLINQVKPAKKKDGIVIIDALSELLVSELLIPDAKLRPFAAHALAHLDDISSGNRQTRRNVLKLWYYEDQLKELYGTYVEALNKFAHDSVDANKEKAVSAMSYLLMHHPEREKMLLANIINKLGDPTQAVASKVVYHLCQVLYNHPNMKAVVLKEIEKMLFRTNISPRAQYYGICFLNQFCLGKDDSKIAEDLIRIYFSFFKANIKKGDIDSRLMSAILTGVKRAQPFAGSSLAVTSSHTQAVYRLAHLAAPKVATHALALLYHVSETGDAADRFYSALYRKLAFLASTRPSALLLGLVYKALKRDTCVARVAALAKRLLQLCALVPPAQAAGIMFLLSQVLREGKKKDAVKLVWTKRDVKDEEVKEELPKDEEATDQPAVRLDDTTEPLQETETEVVKEEEVNEQKKIDLLRGDKIDLLMDDEEEIYVDLKLDEQGQIKPKKRKPSSAITPGWFHAKVKGEGSGGAGEEVDDKAEVERELATNIQLKKTLNMNRKVSEYTPHARNPAYAGTEHTAYVELAPLAQHFHPTVKLFAEKLANNQLIQYTGDPLKDFSGIRFLDRFVFKNPKRRSETEREVEGEIKKVRGSHPKFAVRKNYSAKGLRSIPVNSSTYLNEDVQKIPVDERFLYDFLKKRRETRGPDASDDSDSDNDSVTSEDFEKYLDTVTGSTAKDDSDEELDFLTEMERSKQQRGKKGKDDEPEDQLGSEDDEDDDVAAGGENDDEADGSDGELNIYGDDDEPALSGDEDELNLQGSDDDDLIEVPGKGKSSKGKIKLKLKGKDDLGSLFASAEEFSTLLEDTAANKHQGSSQAVSNADNSSMKQLAWEDKRDKWIKGFNRKIHGAKKGGSKKFNKSNQKHNGGFNKMAPKSGKRRKDGGGGAGGKKKKFN